MLKLHLALHFVVGLACFAGRLPLLHAASSRPFSFQSWLGPLPSLQLNAPQINGSEVTVTGFDSRRPVTPFTFDWGDGTKSESFFPARHVFSGGNGRYNLTVTAHYPDGEAKETEAVRVGQLDESFQRHPLIPVRVEIPQQLLPLSATLPGLAPPTGLTCFQDTNLAAPRALMEYILDVGCWLEMDFCNQNIDPVADGHHVILDAETAGGAFSLWYTRPMAIGANPSYLLQLSAASSLFHELGHNLTLNSPANFRFGGKIDGPMNTLVSESLAQIFQHATAWELLNGPKHYGLSSDVCGEIRRGALTAFGITATAHRKYLDAGCPYCSVQSGQTDPTFGTFMTIAYVFVREAEDRQTFREPAKRLMALLQTFNESDRQRYRDDRTERFRATLMPAALSYAFQKDLRPTFRQFHFPVDDGIYQELRNRMLAN